MPSRGTASRPGASDFLPWAASMSVTGSIATSTSRSRSRCASAAGPRSRLERPRDPTRTSRVGAPRGGRAAEAQPQKLRSSRAALLLARHRDVSGVLVLAGSGEFTPAMNEIDRELLATLRPRARVAIVPTAAGLEDTPDAWIAKGIAHFRALGAEPVGVRVLNKEDARDPRWREAVADIDWAYFSGGNPGHLVETLQGSPFWS